MFYIITDIYVFLFIWFEKQLFLDSKKRFHTLGMRNLDSPHKITTKEIISKKKVEKNSRSVRRFN
jgi:hypothetical protein